MRYKWAYTIILAFVSVTFLSAQIELPRHVFASFAGDINNQSITLSSSVGEPIVSTFYGGMILNQGFQQNLNAILLSIDTISATCLNGTDGSAFVYIVNAAGPYSYVVDQNATNFSSSDTLVLSNLSYGNHSLYVRDDFSGHEILYNFYISSQRDEECQVFAYSGISPNGDGFDDVWFIENIDEHPLNRVYIYDRWGNRVWDTQGYSNQANFWDGKKLNGNTLATGTYFYVIEIEGLQTQKGWVHISY